MVVVVLAVAVLVVVVLAADDGNFDVGDCDAWRLRGSLLHTMGLVDPGAYIADMEHGKGVA